MIIYGYSPEGYNPSGSFKDNGMATAVTHAKMVGAKKDCLCINWKYISFSRYVCSK